MTEAVCNAFQMEWEDAQRLARRHVERQRGHKEASDEMSCEDLSEGEKETLGPNVPELATIVEAPEGPADAPTQKKEKKLYMVLIR